MKTRTLIFSTIAFAAIVASGCDTTDTASETQDVAADDEAFRIGFERQETCDTLKLLFHRAGTAIETSVDEFSAVGPLTIGFTEDAFAEPFHDLDSGEDNSDIRCKISLKDAEFYIDHDKASCWRATNNSPAAARFRSNIANFKARMGAATFTEESLWDRIVVSIEDARGNMFKLRISEARDFEHLSPESRNKKMTYTSFSICTKTLY